jgi:murein DD-endopeptidase MepM/ murein hydrolase activator NlpD
MLQARRRQRLALKLGEQRSKDFGMHAGRQTAIALLAAAAAAACPTAGAAEPARTAADALGGAAAPGNAGDPRAGGGARYGAVKPEPRAVLRRFALNQPGHVPGARAPRVLVRVDSRARVVRVRVWLSDPSGRTAARRAFLGRLRTGRTHRIVVPTAGLPEGRYTVRLSVRDGRGRAARRGRGAATTLPLTVATHHFPIAGPHGYGGDGARFGAGRAGHTHQGQDLTAALGTPVVAPSAGTVTTVRYQASGAGHYVVLKAPGDAADYVFMHLRERSVRVVEGQQVTAGQQLAEVGSTGSSSGAHLHFEIWVEGGWYTGGHPVDPLPYLRSWDLG